MAALGSDPDLSVDVDRAALDLVGAAPVTCG